VLSVARPASSLDAVPWIVRDYDELVALPLDERTAYVLSLVDGRSTVGQLARDTGWEHRYALSVIARLVAMGALELHDDASPA
jgi:hypothetical protein